MNETPVTDLDDGGDDLARRVRTGVLGAPLTGPGPDLGVVRTRGRRRRRRRQATQAGVLAAAAAAVVTVTTGVLPGQGGSLVAGPPTAAEILAGLGEPAPATGPRALPDLGEEDTGCDQSDVRAGAVRYLGAYDDDRGRFWAVGTRAEQLCFVVSFTPGTFTVRGPATVQNFLDRPVIGAKYGQGFDGFRYAFVPDGYDTTALEADGYVQVLPDVLVED